MATEQHDALHHSTLIYESASERKEAVLSFLNRGLDSNKKCLYIEAESTTPSVINRLTATSTELRTAQADGTLSVSSAGETYLGSGEFDVDGTIALFEDLVESAVDEGYDGICVIAETELVLEHDVALDKWREYERRVNDLFQKHPAMGLCLYDRSRFSSEVLSDVLCSHPKVTDGAGEITNFYYRPHSERSAQALDVNGLDRKLQTLSDVRETRASLRDRERHFVSLKRTIQELNRSDRDEASQPSVEPLTNSLDASIATVCTYDEDTGRLEPLSEARSDPRFEEVPITELLEGHLWEVFASGQERTFEQTLANTPQIAEDGTLNGLILPLGTHGVLVVADQSEWSVSQADRDLLHTAAGVVETALDRREYGQAFEDQRTELEQQNERLTRLEGINQVFQNLSEELVAANSREELQVAACHEIADAGRVAFTWVGEVDRATGALETVDTAGDSDGYFDTIAGECPESGEEPTRRAAESREPQAVTNVRSDAPMADWQTEALRRGVQSAISLPLLYDDELYGILSVYFDQPGILDAEVRNALERIAGLVAQTINGTERKHAFVDGRVTELELRLNSDDHAVLQLVSELDCDFELEGIVPAGDASFRIFATIDAPPVEVLEFGNKAQVIDDMQVVADQDGEYLYECTITDGCFLNILLKHNAVPQSLTACGTTAHVVLDLPVEKRVSEFMDTFHEKYPEADLVAKNTRQRSTRPRAGFKADIESELSERQLETVKTAYFGGYFEWPRESSTEDLADMLDVTHPTISRHLREAQRRVFSELFETEQRRR